jgi:hypothetical protein
LKQAPQSQSICGPRTKKIWPQTIIASSEKKEKIRFARINSTIDNSQLSPGSCFERYRLMRTGAQFCFRDAVHAMQSLRGSLAQCFYIRVHTASSHRLPVKGPRASSGLVFLEGRKLVSAHSKKKIEGSGISPARVRVRGDSPTGQAKLVQRICLSCSDRLANPFFVDEILPLTSALAFFPLSDRSIQF